MRHNPCKIPSHFCLICNKGLNSRHSLCQHQKKCSSSKISKGIEGSAVLPMIVTTPKTRKENDEEITDYTNEDSAMQCTMYLIRLYGKSTIV